jgi:hypothetical protein
MTEFKMMVDVAAEDGDGFHPKMMMVFDEPGDMLRVQEIRQTWRRMYDVRPAVTYRAEEETYWGASDFACLNAEHIKHTGEPCANLFKHQRMDQAEQRATNLRRFKAAGECIAEAQRGYRTETCAKAVHNGTLFCKNHLIDEVYQQGKHAVDVNPEHKYSTLEQVVCVSCQKPAIWLDEGRGRGKVIPVCSDHGQARCGHDSHHYRGYYRTNRDERTWKVTQTHGEVTLQADGTLRCAEHLPAVLAEQEVARKLRIAESDRRANRSNSRTNRDVWAFIEALGSGRMDPQGAVDGARAFIEVTEPRERD